MTSSGGFESLWAARPVLYAAPTTEPVSLSEAQAHLRLSDWADLETLSALIQVAREQLEQDTGRALITQTWDCYWDSLPSGRELWLPKPKLVSVTSVTSVNDAGASATLASTNYLVDTTSEPGRIVLTSSGAWPSDVRSTNGLVVRYVAGYGAAAAVPQALKQALLMLVGSLYEHREQVMVSQFAGQLIEIPFGYAQLIAPYRVGWVF